MTNARSKPAVFIGSSAEGLEVAYALQEELEHECEPTVWPQGIFAPTRSTLSSLLHAARSVQYAAFIFKPDDITIMRSAESVTVRDNVIFELGLFLGALGDSRCFIIQPRNIAGFHLPTDLAGITPLTYEPDRTDKNTRAAIGPAANTIRKAVSNSTPSSGQASPVATQSRSFASFKEALLENKWRLHFDPQAGVSKAISFEPGGTIGVGSNRNEHTWRISSDGLLEIYQQDGRLHSRFAFDADRSRFTRTNDPDTTSKRDQYIEVAKKLTVVILD